MNFLRTPNFFFKKNGKKISICGIFKFVKKWEKRQGQA
jgi:hypothetical protein